MWLPLRLSVPDYMKGFPAFFTVENGFPAIYLNVNLIRKYKANWIKTSIIYFTHEFVHFIQWAIGRPLGDIDNETPLDRYEAELQAYTYQELMAAILELEPAYRTIEELAESSTRTYIRTLQGKLP